MKKDGENMWESPIGYYVNEDIKRNIREIID